MAAEIIVCDSSNKSAENETLLVSPHSHPLSDTAGEMEQGQLLRDAPVLTEVPATPVPANHAFTDTQGSLRETVEPNTDTVHLQEPELVMPDLPALMRDPDESRPENQDTIEQVQKVVNGLIDIWSHELETQYQQKGKEKLQVECNQELDRLKEQYHYELRIVESSYRTEISYLRKKLAEGEREIASIGQICQGLDRKLRENEAEKDEVLRQKDEELEEKEEELSEKEMEIRNLEERLRQTECLREESERKIRENAEKISKVRTLVSRLSGDRWVIKEVMKEANRELADLKNRVRRCSL